MLLVDILDRLNLYYTTPGEPIEELAIPANKELSLLVFQVDNKNYRRVQLCRYIKHIILSGKEELISKIQKAHHRDYNKFQVDFDHFGTTHTETNKNNIYKFFNKNRNLFKEKEIQQLFDEEKNQFLSDRYVIGECPECHAKDQYGDGCEVCGKQYSANELINPVSKLSNTKPILKNTTQIFYDTNHFREKILDWLNNTNIQNKINQISLIKKNIGTNPKVIRRKLDKFDPKKSSGTYKKISRYLNLKKYNFTKLENGLIKTIDSMK